MTGPYDDWYPGVAGIPWWNTPATSWANGGSRYSGPYQNDIAYSVVEWYS